MKYIILILAIISMNLLGEELGKTESFVRSTYGSQIKNPKDLDVFTNYLVGKNKLKKVKKIRCRYIATQPSKLYMDSVILEVKDCESVFPFKAIKLPKIQRLFIFHVSDKNKYVGEFIDSNKLFVIPKVAISIDEEIAIKY